jgi:S-formylglutathione hydrolase FrmB
LPQVSTPQLPNYHHGISLLGGWLPILVEVSAAVVVLLVIGWRTRRWRLWSVPLSAAIGVAASLAVRTWVNSEGLASDPSPWPMWVWAAVFVATIPIAVLGWRGTPWWRRTLSVLAVPLTLLATLLTLDKWVGYYPSVQSAWGALTAGPLPHETDAADLPALRNTSPDSGKLVEVAIPDTSSGFKHRDEYVYLPPAWFSGATPPALPVVMMIAGEFNTPADWMRSGNITQAIDDYAHEHGEVTPVFVFVDSGGRFNNDTECVNGPRGNAADHLTKDVRPYLISQFGTASDAAHWGVVGWSMGGTCAIDLAVMHPDLFGAFVDIAGDHGPTAGSKQQTIDRLYGGDAAQWAAFDPATVMRAHGPYTGVSGLFEDTTKPAAAKGNSPAHPLAQPSAPLGFGGHDDWRDTDETGAAEDLCTVALSVQIPCAIHTQVSFHTWQFAERSFTDALPWIAGRLHTPTAPPG